MCCTRRYQTVETGIIDRATGVIDDNTTQRANDAAFTGTGSRACTGQCTRAFRLTGREMCWPTKSVRHPLTRKREERRKVGSGRRKKLGCSFASYSILFLRRASPRTKYKTVFTHNSAIINSRTGTGTGRCCDAGVRRPVCREGIS